MTDTLDLGGVLIQCCAGDLAAAAIYTMVAALLPGLVLRRICGWACGARLERWTLDLILGVLWNSLTYYALAFAQRPQYHAAFAIGLPGLITICGWWRRRRRSLGLGRWPRYELAALALIAGFVAAYLIQVAALAVVDAQGLRLYGATFSDKFSGMSQATALVHNAPAADLRLAGVRLPYHFFPHLYLAAASRPTGVDVKNLYWFFGSALGIAANGLALVVFARRLLRLRWLCPVGLLLIGFARFGPEVKPIDLSLPMLLLALTAIGRYRSSRRRRWAVLAVLLIAAMPWYETFHSLAALAGLGVWWLAAIVPALFRRGVRSEMVLRSAVFLPSAVASLAAVQLLTLGARAVSPTQLAWKNTYRESYKAEWAGLAANDSTPEWIATLYQWKRGRTVTPAGDTAGQKFAWPKRLLGEAVFELGFPLYLIVAHVNLAIFGLVALARRGIAAIGMPYACIILFGFLCPLLVTFGHVADNRWWDSPNLYRFTTVAWVLAVLAGMGELARQLIAWRRWPHWPMLALAAWQLCAMGLDYSARPHAYLLVPRDVLAALARLRQEPIDADHCVLSPWIDDLICDDRRQGAVDYVYKRHATLVANLAGQTAYYEGPEYHLFNGGFVDPAEVFRRSRARRGFYQSDVSPAEISAWLAATPRVAYVVADRRVATPPLPADWQVLYSNATVSICRRPD